MVGTNVLRLHRKIIRKVSIFNLEANILPQYKNKYRKIKTLPAWNRYIFSQCREIIRKIMFFMLETNMLRQHMEVIWKYLGTNILNQNQNMDRKIQTIQAGDKYNFPISRGYYINIYILNIWCVGIYLYLFQYWILAQYREKKRIGKI